MIYLGIDQTGAVDSKGRPKPLSACLLDGKNFELKFIKCFDLGSIQAVFPQLNPIQGVIGVDCVLGLPRALKLDWREALKKTLEQEGYGRISAKNYFRQLGQGKLYHREVELQCQANSVFQELPFQKNIQTGTFRFWKEMAQNPDWFYAPWVLGEQGLSRVPVIEGYPSLAWKLLFQVRSRSPQKLSLLLREFEPELDWSPSQQNEVERNPNFADALVLALALKRYWFPRMDLKPSVEGWILGAVQSGPQSPSR
jgi:hypothetical protein